MVSVQVHTNFFFFFVLVFAVYAANANIAEFDDYWKSRADEAQKNALEAFNPHPEEVTQQLNDDVGM